MIFYVYILRRPDKPDPFDQAKGQPFYVGKGKNGRIGEHRSRERCLKSKSIKNNIIHKLRKNGLDFEEEFVAKNLTEDQAFEIECSLIKQYGKIVNNTGILANLTDGGEGTSGLVRCHSQETRRKIGETQKCRIIPIEVRKKISETLKGKAIWNKGIKLSPEHCQKISEGGKGRKHSDITIQKMKETHKNKKKIITNEQRNKISESLKTFYANKEQDIRGPRSSETRRKLREANLGKKLSTEHRQNISDGLNKHYQNQLNKGGIAP